MVDYFRNNSAMAINFVVKIVRLKVYIIFASPMTMTFTQGHNCLQLFNVHFNSNVLGNIYAMTFSFGMTVDLCIA